MEDLTPQEDMHQAIPVWLGGYKGFFYYMHTYDNTIKILTEKIEEKNHTADDVLFPFLFLVRHSLELGYKANLIHFNEFLGTEFDLTKSNHNLELLHIEFTKTISKVDNNLNDEYGIQFTEDDENSFNNYFNEVDKLKNIYKEIDSSAMAFRYPVDKKNNKFFNDSDQLDLRPIIDLYKKSIIFLTHTQDVYERYFECARDMERDFL